MRLINEKEQILIMTSNHDIKKEHSKGRGKEDMFKHKQAYRLQMLRRKHGLTTRKLAEKLGVSNGIVSRWCRGDAYPTRKHVRVICEYFKVEPAWLIYGIDDKPQENDLSFVYDSLNDKNKDSLLDIARALLNAQINYNKTGIDEEVSNGTNGDREG